MFKTLGFSFDMNKSNPMRELSMAIKRYQAKSKHETIDELWKHARASWACKRWWRRPGHGQDHEEAGFQIARYDRLLE
jgi:hypothetical protein